MRVEPRTYYASECGRFVCELVEHAKRVKLHSPEDAEALLEAHRAAWADATETGFRPKASASFRKAGELHCALIAIQPVRAARAA